MKMARIGMSMSMIIVTRVAVSCLPLSSQRANNKTPAQIPDKNQAISGPVTAGFALSSCETPDSPRQLQSAGGDNPNAYAEEQCDHEGRVSMMQAPHEADHCTRTVRLLLPVPVGRPALI